MDGPLEPGPYGIAVRKDDTELRDLLREALQAVIADGTYERVLQRWGVSEGSLTTAQINAGSGPTDPRPA